MTSALLLLAAVWWVLLVRAEVSLGWIPVDTEVADQALGSAPWTSPEIPWEIIEAVSSAEVHHYNARATLGDLRFWWGRADRSDPGIQRVTAPDGQWMQCDGPRDLQFRRSATGRLLQFRCRPQGVAPDPAWLRGPRAVRWEARRLGALWQHPDACPEGLLRAVRAATARLSRAAWLLGSASLVASVAVALGRGASPVVPPLTPAPYRQSAAPRGLVAAGDRPRPRSVCAWCVALALVVAALVELRACRAGVARVPAQPTLAVSVLDHHGA